MKIKRGFTLAEVLITLTIIGVIAAVTIPSLITNVDLDKKQAEATIKKTYTTFNDATKQIVMMETTSHTMASVGCADNNCIRDLYSKYVSYVKTCNSDAQTNCLDGAPAKGNSTDNVDFTGKSLAVLADGTLVGFSYDSTCATTVKSVIEFEQAPVDVAKACVTVAVDTNGAKKPNTDARDRYQFAIGKLGVKFKAAAAATP